MGGSTFGAKSDEKRGDGRGGVVANSRARVGYQLVWDRGSAILSSLAGQRWDSGGTVSIAVVLGASGYAVDLVQSGGTVLTGMSVGVGAGTSAR